MEECFQCLVSEFYVLELFEHIIFHHLEIVCCCLFFFFSNSSGLKEDPYDDVIKDLCLASRTEFIFL